MCVSLQPTQMHNVLADPLVMEQTRSAATTRQCVRCQTGSVLSMQSRERAIQVAQCSTTAHAGVSTSCSDRGERLRARRPGLRVHLPVPRCGGCHARRDAF